MELRHLRYFVAVAEEGSLTNAAERRLHTAQPSLSRQIRDLELEVGVKLLDRGARGIELTPAGRVFLDHARLALLQVEAAVEAARRGGQPRRGGPRGGFLRDEFSSTEGTILSQAWPELAEGLARGRIDLAFMRAEKNAQGLSFRLL